MKPVRKATPKRTRTGEMLMTGETSVDIVLTMPISRMTVDMNRKPIVATSGVAMRDTPFIMAASASFGLECARIIVAMAEARPTRKIGMPAMKPTTRTMNGKKAFQEVVEYSRDSISLRMRSFSAASILTPRRFMSIVMRMADITKMEPAAMRPRTLKRP